MKEKNTHPDTKKTMADRLGNFVEKIGHKVSQAGAPNLGRKIHDLGDRIEKTHSNPKHPHKS